MALEAGTKLGSYEILTAIGAGGMGEVYRARDTKLGREVAIKVLPEEFTQHSQKLARFEREARLLAALNHPGIATLHGLEKVKGKPFLVMELVEGETLAERIARGPLPVEEALTLSQQIAEALEAAHEKGVIHRDLKPANIKVDPEGKVKVLDFGLAKAFAEEVPESELSQSPTLSRDATRAGVILGTAAYMSPEQAKGKIVDKRSDIFSFGIVLYEMLTGKRAFSGEDVSDVLAAIIRSEPDWKAVPSSLDPRIQNLLRRCLTKDRKNRLRDIGDARFEIQQILTEPPVASEAVKARAPVLAWGLSIVVTALVTGIAVWSVIIVDGPGPQTILRFSVTLPPGDAFTRTGRHVVALSPDGTRLVYVANGQLYLREMDQLEAAPIRGTDIDPSTPFFSPDGEWVGFFSLAQGQLKKISVTGGAPVTLCEAGAPFGASWGADDTIVFGQGLGGILRVSANGGTPEVLIPMDSDKNEIGHGPQMLPDGETVLFALGTTTSTSWDESQIVTQSLETGERRVLIQGGSDARYVPTGHLVYALGETLLAVPFDLERLTVTGGPVPVVEGVARAGIFSGAAHASFSDSGSLVYVAGSATQATRLVWVDRNGEENPFIDESRGSSYPRLSPDEGRVAYVNTEIDGHQDIYILDVARGTRTRLTVEGESNRWPIWTPDGNRMAFTSIGDDSLYALYWKPTDGSGPAEKLLEKSERWLFPHSWSPDGRVLSYYETETTTDGNKDLWVLPIDGEPQPFVVTPFREVSPIFSPDGQWIAYVSTESGEQEVYVTPYPGPGPRTPVSSGGGGEPSWSSDGRELFYRNGAQMLAVEIQTQPAFHAGRPVVLFEDPYELDSFGPGNPNYDVAADGERFLMVKRSEDVESSRIHVVLNWFEELKRLVPTN